MNEIKKYVIAEPLNREEAKHLGVVLLGLGILLRKEDCGYVYVATSTESELVLSKFANQERQVHVEEMKK